MPQNGEPRKQEPVRGNEMVEVDCTEFGDEGELAGFSTCKPGTYHLVVLEADDSFGKFDAITIECEVLAGTVPGQEGKKLTGFFNNGKPSDKDGGKFARKRQARIAMVLGLLTPAALGQKVTVDFALAAGRQFVATVKERDGKEGKKFAEIEGLNFWSVTDPATADVPKDANALAMIGVVAGGLGAVGAGGGGVATAVQQATQAPVDQFANI